jgi:hypothetical protein
MKKIDVHTHGEIQTAALSQYGERVGLRFSVFHGLWLKPFAACGLRLKPSAAYGVGMWLLLPLLLLLTGCGKDAEKDVNGGENHSTATMSIAVVFAPGQLGDMGYADNVLEGVYRLKKLDQTAQPDTLDVYYLACDGLESAIEEAQSLVNDPLNPFSGQPYKRRLLVLTEPFMVDWIEPMKTKIREEDEVLVLKVNKADVSAAAQRLNLGNRLHGLNISAASSARRYCNFIKTIISYAQDEYDVEFNSGLIDPDEPYVHLNSNHILFYRLYDQKQVAYRDSIEEVLREEFGDNSVISVISVASEVGNGIFTNDTQNTILQEAYKYGQHLQELYDNYGYGFHVADLGSAAHGMSYYFMGRSNPYLNVLMLDSETPSQYWVKRNFGAALYYWGIRWMRTRSVGIMPSILVFGDWNGNYVTDNLDVDDTMY